MPTKQTLMTVLLAVTCATSASAQCLSDAQVSDLVANYVAKQPAANIEGLSDADGACTRAKVNSLLAQRFGKVVGYKAGLTNPAVQKRFNTDKPVWGKLYEGMVLANGAAVEAGFGARPLFEADMLVRVKSAVPRDALLTVSRRRKSDETYIRYLPIREEDGSPPPTRRVVLAWRRSFTRYEAIAALRNAIYACELPGVTRLS